MHALVTRQPFNPELIPVRGRPDGAPGDLVTVSQVTAMVRRALADALPPTLHVVGELSNFKRHGSGHLYFTLKDNASELSCVIWRSDAQRMKFEPSDGLEVVATGRVEVFERAGRYQLYARKLEPRGVGALELAFRQLREKLEREGLFDRSLKKPLPRFPRRIAIVTSPTGAAIADMIDTIHRRFACAALLLFPVRVQGEGAAGEIARAIRKINGCAQALGGVDVMIVGRGGGSLEDLWAFNEEVVARAIHASRIPVVSAVGHEVDVTIADLAADVRAATPTAAGELVVPVLEEVLGTIDGLAERLRRSLASRLQLERSRLANALARPAFRDPRAVVYRRDQLVDELAGRLYRQIIDRLGRVRRRLDAAGPAVDRIAPHRYLRQQATALQSARHRLQSAMSSRWHAVTRRATLAADLLHRVSPARALPSLRERIERDDDALTGSLRHRLQLMSARLEAASGRLAAVSHTSVLARGFSVTRTKKGRKVVRSLNDLSDGVRVMTRLADGEFESEVVNLDQLELFDEP
jgi:exodeoxyribonuclease VII large subunit